MNYSRAADLLPEAVEAVVEGVQLIFELAYLEICHYLLFSDEYFFKGSINWSLSMRNPYAFVLLREGPRDGLDVPVEVVVAL